jgi:hypothetical protein
MGGPGSGGQRPGAGRKPKNPALRVLDGNAGHRKVVTHPSVPQSPSQALPPLDPSEAPNELTVDERNVWLRLAPYARANGTLTPATGYSFNLLCRNIVLERRYADSVTDAGSANHRGLIQRIDAELLRFNLSPCGKPLVVSDEKPESKVDRYIKRPVIA